MADVGASYQDPELTLRKMGTSLFWGSVYNIPMMAPIAAQILKTTISRTWVNCQKVIGRRKHLEEEFVVTPKTKTFEHSIRPLISKLRAELVVGAGIVICAIASGHLIALLFAAPQILSAISLPILIYHESISKIGWQRGRFPYYAPHNAYENLPSPAIQRISVR